MRLRAETSLKTPLWKTALTKLDGTHADFLRFVAAMRDIDQRKGQFRMQAQDFLAESASESGIEIRKRLVHQQNARLRRERSRQRDTLLLSARKFPRPDIQIVAKPDEVCDAVNTPVAFYRRDSTSAQSKRDIFGNAHVRPKREVLKHHPDAAELRRDENFSRARNDFSVNVVFRRYRAPPTRRQEAASSICRSLKVRTTRHAHPIRSRAKGHRQRAGRDRV